MEIKNLQTDADFQKVMDSVDKYIDAINKYQEDNPTLVQPTAMELAQFHKSHFYHNWLHRYRRLFAFGPLGNHGVIAIPNTTFEEWLYWFSEWAEAFMDDYNAFKKLVFEALLLIEKHLEAVDAELENHESRITANEAHLADHDAQLAEHQKHLEQHDQQIAKEIQDRINGDNAEKTAREQKDIDLQNQINAEKTARTDEDHAQQGRLNVIENKDREQDGRLNNIESKNTQQDSQISGNTKAINDEKTAREQGDTKLTNQISTLQKISFTRTRPFYKFSATSNVHADSNPPAPEYTNGQGLRLRTFSEDGSNNDVYYDYTIEINRAKVQIGDKTTTHSYGNPSFWTVATSTDPKLVSILGNGYTSWHYLDGFTGDLYDSQNKWLRKSLPQFIVSVDNNTVYVGLLGDSLGWLEKGQYLNIAEGTLTPTIGRINGK